MLAALGSLSQVIEDDKTKNDEYKNVKLAYGLGWGYLETPYGNGFFKEGRGTGFYHYSILFPESGKGVLVMSNSENTGIIFPELLKYTVETNICLGTGLKKYHINNEKLCPIT